MNREIEKIIKKNKYRASFYQHHKRPIQKTESKPPLPTKFEKEPKEKKKIKIPLIHQILAACMCLLLGLVIRKDQRLSSVNRLIFTNINMMKIDHLITDNLGSIFPIPDSDDLYVNLPIVDLSNTEKYYDGVMVTTRLFSEVNSHVEGIVVEIRNDQKIGKIIVIQDKMGREYEYGMIDNIKVKLYSRIQKGEVLGISKTQGDYESGFYLAVRKGNEYLNVLDVMNDDGTY